MATSHATLKLFRKIHLYLGVFISPALLFFAFTGAIQTFNLHEASQGSSYKPPAWLVTLGQIHKKQTAIVPVRKPRPELKPDAQKPDAAQPEGAHPDHPHHDHAATPNAATPNAASPDAVTPASPAPAGSVTLAPIAPRPKSHLPLKIFFLFVSVGLFTSTLTGLYMSYKYNQSKLVLTSLLVAGTILPLLLLPF